MIPVEFGFDEASSAVLPGAELAAGDTGEWADAVASRLAAHQSLSPEQTTLLSAALTRAQHSARTDGATNLLLFEERTRTFAPVRFAVLDEEISERDQRTFLWPPATLRPQLRTTTSGGLGEGCSCTVRAEDGRGSVRWLFVPVGATFFAALGPVPAPSIMFAAAMVEDILQTVRLDGRIRETSGNFEPTRFVSAQTDEGWRS